MSLTTNIQFVENGSGFLSINHQVLALVTDMSYDQKLASDKVATFDSAFFESAVGTWLSASIDGSFICTSGYSFSNYSSYTGTSKIQAGTLTGSTNGLALLNIQQTRAEVTYCIKLAANEVIRGSAIIDDLSYKAKAGSILTGQIKLTCTTKPAITTT